MARSCLPIADRNMPYLRRACTCAGSRSSARRKPARPLPSSSPRSSRDTRGTCGVGERRIEFDRPQRMGARLRDRHLARHAIGEDVEVGGAGMGRRMRRIDRERLLEEGQCAEPAGLRPLVEKETALQKRLAHPGIDGGRRGGSRCDGASVRSARISDAAVRATSSWAARISLGVTAIHARQQMRVGRGVDQLHGDPDLVAFVDNGAFHDRADAQLACDLWQRLAVRSVGLYRRLRDHAKFSIPRELRNEGVRHTEGEVLVVLAIICPAGRKWQYRQHLDRRGPHCAIGAIRDASDDQEQDHDGGERLPASGRSGTGAAGDAGTGSAGTGPTGTIDPMNR